VIFTIGHSTRSLEEFLSLLHAHGITRLADVRTVPRSRRHPCFGSSELSSSLDSAGITYRHFPDLGGLRKPRRDSKNVVWRNEGFRGYADYMETPEFDEGIEELLGWGGEGRREPSPRVAIMCAEAVWWRCHRQLIADALLARGVPVAHIMSLTAPPLHELTPFARVVDQRVRYSAP
jgi:uncharacterized protein (DUF488 family)